MERRVAANRIQFVHNDPLSGNVVVDKEYVNHVVELFNSRVVNHYPLRGELPMTEWLGGTIVIENYRAWHISVLADGTQRRQQL